MILEAVAAESRQPLRKSDGTFVTAIDTAVEERFIKALREALPDIPILGEEEASNAPIEARDGAYDYYASFMGWKASAVGSHGSPRDSGAIRV